MHRKRNGIENPAVRHLGYLVAEGARPDCRLLGAVDLDCCWQLQRIFSALSASLAASTLHACGVEWKVRRLLAEMSPPLS